jgi:hypothetical protein
MDKNCKKTNNNYLFDKYITNSKETNEKLITVIVYKNN